MGYFAVVLARHEGGWAANEVELDEVEDLGDLADQMRDTADTDDADGPYLLFLEQEDAWFAVVRVDDEEDPRVFVSDRSAVLHSAYAEMLLEAAGEVDPEAAAGIDADDDYAEDGEQGGRGVEDSEDADDADDPTAESGPAGDAEVLADLGTDPRTLLDLCVKEGMLPSEVLGALAENAGAADVLESVR